MDLWAPQAEGRVSHWAAVRRAASGARLPGCTALPLVMQLFNLEKNADSTAHCRDSDLAGPGGLGAHIFLKTSISWFITNNPQSVP